MRRQIRHLPGRRFRLGLLQRHLHVDAAYCRFSSGAADLHNDWSPAQIKSALVNRADLVLKDAKTGIHDIGPTAQGAGRENLSVAANGTTWLSPVSASFGKVPAGSPTSVVVTVFNPTGNAQNFTVSKWKFTPGTFGDTVSSIYGAGTITSGDSRVSVVPSFTVPAGGSYNL